MDTEYRSAPAKTDKILWWFSTANEKVIKNCTTDSNRYRIIGIAVMFTWLYATLAWSYFWSTTTNNPLVYIPVGIFMGAFILAIDRVLIASINKGNNNIAAVFLRVGLAIAIGAFLAQPVILMIFKDDINREVPILIDKKFAEKKLETDSLFMTRKNELLANKAEIEQRIAFKDSAATLAENEYLKEIDGTGGSGKYGIAGIAKQKRITADSVKSSLEALKADQQPHLIKIRAELDSIEAKKNADFAIYKQSLTQNGFLIKKEALQTLIKKDNTGTLKTQYLLLMLILTLFELIPIISKMFLPVGAYDEKMRLRDLFEIKKANREADADYALHKIITNENFAENENALHNFFRETSKNDPEINGELINQWRSGKFKSRNELWEAYKQKAMVD